MLLWQFTTIWNDYLIGLVVLSNHRAPVNVAVQKPCRKLFRGMERADVGALIAALPTILVYLALGKLFLRGLLAGSLKG